jgi:heat shock protein HslJ
MLMLFISACGSTKKTAKNESTVTSINNITWLLQLWETNGSVRTMHTNSSIHLIFNESEKQVSGSDGCNNFIGNYEVKKNKLMVGPTAGTKKYCGEESSLDEQAFLKILQSTPEIELMDGKLRLILKTEILTFYTKN